MGFLSKLFRSPNDRAKQKGLQKSDRVYIDRKAANNALIKLCIDAGVAKRQVVIIHFFKATKQEFDEAVINATNVLWVNAFFAGQIRQG